MSIYPSDLGFEELEEGRSGILIIILTKEPVGELGKLPVCSNFH